MAQIGMWNVLRSGWLGKTRQLWKLGVFILLLMLDGLVFVILLSSIYGGRNFKTDEIFASFMFVVTSLVTFGWFFLVFRCPGCRLNVGRFVLQNSDSGSWFHNLLLLRCCPRCQTGKSSVAT